MSECGMLYFMIGKMGAGKSTYSLKLAAETGAILISEDDWLNALYPDEIKNFDDFLVRHRKLLNLLGPHVKSILEGTSKKTGTSVILDFPANTVESRQWFLSLAHAVNAPHTAVYIEASNERCIEQVAKRALVQPERAKFDTPETFAMVNKFFEHPMESEGLNVRLIKGE